MQFMIMNTAAAGSGGGKNEATGAGFVEFTVSIFCHFEKPCMGVLIDMRP